MKQNFNFLSILFFCLIAFSSCENLGRGLLKTFKKTYETNGPLLTTKPIYQGKDSERQKIAIDFREVTKVNSPTDIQFTPKLPFIFLLEKGGEIKVFDRSTGKIRTLHSFGVLTDSEEGLLGLAFSPRYPKEPKAYINSVRSEKGKDLTFLTEITIESPEDYDKMKVKAERILFHVEQPYPNHNAGQLAFGPDNNLYIGLGDGGWRGDPKGHGQNPSTLLGSVLRISPFPKEGMPYSIPNDNPFVSKPGFLPEIYAYGIRNPWKFSFSKDGYLYLADVGQDEFEEINKIESGHNYGWNQTEGFHCYQKNCDSTQYASPIHEYDHSEGQSITGGFVYQGKSIPELTGKYVYGDFIQGKIWALPLDRNGNKSGEPYSLGKRNLLISTFGEDEDGELFVADFQSGKIFKIVSSEK